MPHSFQFAPTRAIVRRLSNSFFQCLKQQTPKNPINVDLAKNQHEAYVKLLRELIPAIVELPADEQHPDCCFVEDTAVVIGDIAAMSYLGALERRGEEVLIRETFRHMGLDSIVDIVPPGTLDGGDVLFTGRQIYVGLSGRTNRSGIDQLIRIFGSRYPVHIVPVQGSLHLKSVMSALDRETLLFADSLAGRMTLEFMKSNFSIKQLYHCHLLPDAVSANVLSIGSTLVIQDGFPESESLLTDLVTKKNMKIAKLQMSELIKADGALTCCSILY